MRRPEFTRTHWAVKQGDLYAILRDAGHMPQQAAAIAEPAAATEPTPAIDITPAKVFLVHGRDEAAKHAVARFLERRVGLDVIILSERPNRGRSILTKFREEADGASFAVVLMTPDDLGHLRPGLLPLAQPLLRRSPGPARTSCSNSASSSASSGSIGLRTGAAWGRATL